MSLTKSCMFRSSVGAFWIEANIEFNLQHIRLHFSLLGGGEELGLQAMGTERGGAEGGVQRGCPGEAEGANEEKTAVFKLRWPRACPGCSARPRRRTGLVSQ